MTESSSRLEDWLMTTSQRGAAIVNENMLCRYLRCALVHGGGLNAMTHATAWQRIPCTDTSHCTAMGSIYGPKHMHGSGLNVIRKRASTQPSPKPRPPILSYPILSYPKSQTFSSRDPTHEPHPRYFPILNRVELLCRHNTSSHSRKFVLISACTSNRIEGSEGVGYFGIRAKVPVLRRGPPTYPILSYFFGPQTSQPRRSIARGNLRRAP